MSLLHRCRKLLVLRHCCNQARRLRLSFFSKRLIFTCTSCLSRSNKQPSSSESSSSRFTGSSMLISTWLCFSVRPNCAGPTWCSTRSTSSSVISPSGSPSFSCNASLRKASSFICRSFWASAPPSASSLWWRRRSFARILRARRSDSSRERKSLRPPASSAPKVSLRMRSLPGHSFGRNVATEAPSSRKSLRRSLVAIAGFQASRS
mmetsp:Transcript_43441/g.82876  ORF Transcript_43441/g.82876 Transcript_43441/m.82876 type:complete len:206 (+) Transcript_43441:1267-1884(+)